MSQCWRAAVSRDEWTSYGDVFLQVLLLLAAAAAAVLSLLSLLSLLLPPLLLLSRLLLLLLSLLLLLLLLLLLSLLSLLLLLLLSLLLLLLLLLLLNNGWGRCWPLCHGRRRHLSLARLQCNWWWRADLPRSLPMTSRTGSRRTEVRTSSAFNALYRLEDAQDCSCVAADHRVGARCPQCGRHSVMAAELCHLRRRRHARRLSACAMGHCVPHPSAVQDMFAGK